MVIPKYLSINERVSSLHRSFRLLHSKPAIEHIQLQCNYLHC